MNWFCHCQVVNIYIYIYIYIHIKVDIAYISFIMYLIYCMNIYISISETELTIEGYMYFFFLGVL